MALSPVMPMPKTTEMSPADRMRAHAAAVWKIPAGEQYIGAIQSVVSIALEDVARWMDDVEKRIPPKENPNARTHQR